MENAQARARYLLVYPQAQYARRMIKFYEKNGGIPVDWWGLTKAQDERNYEMLKFFTRIIVSNDTFGNKMLQVFKHLQETGAIDQNVQIVKEREIRYWT